MLNFDPFLCLVTDRSFRPETEFLSTIESAIDAGVTWVQFREKTGLSDRRVWSLGVQVRSLTKDRGIPFIVDDRLDLAIALDADGIHLGQGDLPLAALRQLWKPGKLWGVSVSSLGEAIEAKQEGADYIGVGALFPTTTKADALPVAPQILSELTRVGLPLIGIGGVTPERVAILKELGCSGVAVISAIWGLKIPRRLSESLLDHGHRVTPYEEFPLESDPLG